MQSMLNVASDFSLAHLFICSMSYEIHKKGDFFEKKWIGENISFAQIFVDQIHVDNMRHFLT